MEVKILKTSKKCNSTQRGLKFIKPLKKCITIQGGGGGVIKKIEYKNTQRGVKFKKPSRKVQNLMVF